MGQVSFQLTQAGLTDYQFAVRDRLQRRKRFGILQQPAVIWLGMCFAGFLVTVAGFQAIERFLDRPMELPEFLLGLVLGFSAMLATAWVHYLDQRRGLARPDGPILSPQTMRLSAEGIAVQSVACDVLYRWPAVEAITHVRGLIVFWVEPGAGLAVPAEAFASDAARKQFIAEAEVLRSAAGVA